MTGFYSLLPDKSSFDLLIFSYSKCCTLGLMVLALDLGGTKLSAALLSPTGELKAKNYVLLEGRHGAAVGDLIVQFINSYSKDYGTLIQGIGIAVPGISRQKSGTVWAPNIGGWEDFPLIETIRSNFPDYPVWMDSDRACSVMGEVWQGEAQGCRDAIFLAIGTGIGAGIWSDSRVIRGHADIAGAIGWWALDRPYLAKYQACGCYEYHASGDGIARVAIELLASSHEPSQLRSLAHLTSQHVFQAVAAGDYLARKTLDTAIEFWGMAAANLVSLFNPEKIIFGGGVFGPGIDFIPAIYAQARLWAQPISIDQVTFLPSRLGSEANLYGAAFMVYQALQQQNFTAHV